MAEYVVEEPSDRSASWRVHERIVRCRDCEHARHYHPFYMGKRSSIEEWYCEWHSNAEGASDIEPDGFCAWGKRKESA
jgi:hypothetical protein